MEVGTVDDVHYLLCNAPLHRGVGVQPSKNLDDFTLAIFFLIFRCFLFVLEVAGQPDA